MVEEACLPWPAIPDSANKYSNLNIMEVVQSLRADRPDLSVVVASSWFEHPPRFKGAWRIGFKGALVYRRRKFEDTGNLPLTRPDDLGALWEIYPSNYFLQEDARKAAYSADDPYRRHHYVICTGAGDVFEVIAWHWSVEELGPEWAHPFDYPVPN